MDTAAQNQSGISPAQYARHRRISLDYVYRLLACGRLVADKSDGRWIIQQPAEEKVNDQVAEAV